MNYGLALRIELLCRLACTLAPSGEEREDVLDRQIVKRPKEELAIVASLLLLQRCLESLDIYSRSNLKFLRG